VLNNQSNEERIQLFSTAIQKASEGILITDMNNNIIECNPSFESNDGFRKRRSTHPTQNLTPI